MSDWGSLTSKAMHDNSIRKSSKIKWWAVFLKDENGKEKIVQIENAKKGVAYSCPECFGQMGVRKGEVKAHHFYHKPTTDNVTACGGEGSRHFRVKSILFSMLNSWKTTHMMPEIQIRMEKKIDSFIPDISVEFGQNEILAIEIVDKNPPSYEKKEEWKDSMLLVEITKWSDEDVADIVKVSGLLINSVVSCTQFFEQVVTDMRKLGRKHKEARDDLLHGINKLEKELQAEVAKIEEKVEEEHFLKMQELYDKQDDEFRKNATLRRVPGMFVGSYSDLSRYGRNDEWGVSVDVSGPGTKPEYGDYVFVVTRKKMLGLVQIGERVNESADWTIYYFEKLRELPSQEFSKIIPILEIVKQKMNKK